MAPLLPPISPVLNAVSFSGCYLWRLLPDTDARHLSLTFTQTEREQQKERGQIMGAANANSLLNLKLSRIPLASLHLNIKKLLWDHSSFMFGTACAISCDGSVTLLIKWRMNWRYKQQQTWFHFPQQNNEHNQTVHVQNPQRRTSLLCMCLILLPYLSGHHSLHQAHHYKRWFCARVLISAAHGIRFHCSHRINLSAPPLTHALMYFCALTRAPPGAIGKVSQISSGMVLSNYHCFGSEPRLRICQDKLSYSSYNSKFRAG